MNQVENAINELQKICHREKCEYVSLCDPDLIYNLESLLDNHDKNEIENMVSSYKNYDDAIHDYIFNKTAIGADVYQVEELVELLKNNPKMYLEDIQVLVEKYKG